MGTKHTRCSFSAELSGGGDGRRPVLPRIAQPSPPLLRLAHVSRCRWASASCASSEVVLLPRHPRPRPQPDFGPAARAALLLLPNIAGAAASGWLHSCPCCLGCQCPCHRHRLGERESREIESERETGEGGNDGGMEREQRDSWI